METEEKTTLSIPNNERVLMSEQLKGQVPEFDDERLDEIAGSFVHVIADRRFKGEPDPLVGMLKTILFNVEPELEFTVELAEAIRSVSTDGLTFGGFELHHGETDTKIPGPFSVVSARIQDIDPARQTCVLALHLKRVPKA